MDAEKPDFTNSVDAGKELHLMNIFGQQLWSFSPRNYCQLINYDSLQRKTELLIQKITYEGIVNTYDDFNLVEVFTYGESQPNASQNNLNGQLYELKDLSGIITTPYYNMLGEVQETTRQMVTNYKTPVDWKQTPTLQTEKYTTGFEYNALKLGISETTPDNSITSKTYNKAGQIEGINLAFHGGTAQQIFHLLAMTLKTNGLKWYTATDNH